MPVEMLNPHRVPGVGTGSGPTRLRKPEFIKTINPVPGAVTTTSSIGFPVRFPAVCNEMCPGGDLHKNKNCHENIHRRSQGVQ